MIYEFALEPALVAQWHDRRLYRFFEEKFGVTTRRLVSAYPKKTWRILVWKEFRRSPAGNDQNAERNLNALLEWLWENAIKRKSSFEELPTWLERAEAEHGQRPFWAILAVSNPRNHPAVIAADLLIERGHERWPVPELSPVRRRAQDLADAVAPLLRVSRDIVFVDPHFDIAKRRFRDALEAYCDRLRLNIHGLSELSIQLHTSIERFFEPHQVKMKTDEERVYRNLRLSCENTLPALVPLGISLTVVIWKQKERGEKLHNRYILCDLAGAIFPIGLDDEDTGELERYAGESDDINILPVSQHSQRRAQYCLGSGVFELVGESFEIHGVKGLS